MNAPDAPSTWSGTSSPVRSWSVQRLREVRDRFVTPSYVTPRIPTTPIVCSSTASSMPSGVRYSRSFVIGTYRGSISQ